MLSALTVLSATSWPQRFPFWFPLLVITKDVLSIAGAFLVDHLAGSCKIQAHWTGKVSTVCQIVAILWVMLDIRLLPALWSVGVAAVFTLVSGMINLADGIKQLQTSSNA